MSNYGRSHTQHITERVRQAKAKRQAVLQRVRKQRAAVHKRTVTAWVQEGVIMRASD